jgi:hypothetical protein
MNFSNQWYEEEKKIHMQVVVVVMVMVSLSLLGFQNVSEIHDLGQKLCRTGNQLLLFHKVSQEV